MNEAVIGNLVHLLVLHYDMEKYAIAEIRAGLTPDLRAHDVLERETLYAMAEATDEEIKAAIDRYEETGNTL